MHIQIQHFSNLIFLKAKNNDFVLFFDSNFAKKMTISTNLNTSIVSIIFIENKKKCILI